MDVIVLIVCIVPQQKSHYTTNMLILAFWNPSVHHVCTAGHSVVEKERKSNLVLINEFRRNLFQKSHQSRQSLQRPCVMAHLVLVRALYE